MSATMENHSQPPIPAPPHHDEDDAQSEVGDGSSSLSDIEQEAEQDDLDDLDSEEASDEEEEENDSEAETERLHLSPNKDRAHKDVVMTETDTFVRQPSNLHNQYGADENEDDEEEDDDEDNEEGDNNIQNDDVSDDVSDDELSLPDSPKSGTGDAVADDIDDTESPQKIAPAAASAPKDIMHAFDLTNKKRKRSQIIDRGSLGQNDTDEPSRKRTGSVLAGEDDYAVDDDNGSEHDGMDTPNPVSGELSDIESIDGQDDDEDAEATLDKAHAEIEAEDHMDITEDMPLDRRARKSVSKARPAILAELAAAGKEVVEGGEQVDDTAEVEADDDAEAALKDEAEQEKKRIALEQLGDIEKHFSSFRDRLHEDRLAKLNHEEWMLKQDPPIHPEYLAMMQCIDQRRDERLRLEERRIAYHTQTINKVAVARRAQILSQFYQDVRKNREDKLSLLGKQWYEIQHDRRSHGKNVQGWALEFPTRRQEQLKNQVAYNTEVSILSGIAKYRGFPAAPEMASATAEERDEDFKRMGKTHQPKHTERVRPSLPLQDIAALRAASTGVLNPAEEQFIEQTPWANPKHPSHAHLLQRQNSALQAVARTGSPFSTIGVPQPRKTSTPQGPGLPISGTFSGVNSGSHPIHHGFTQGIGRRPLGEFNL